MICSDHFETTPSSCRSGTAAEYASYLECESITDDAGERIAFFLHDSAESNFLSGKNLMVIIEYDGIRIGTGHFINAERIAEPIGIAGVIHVAVGIQVGINRHVF